MLVAASAASLADLADYRNWIDPLFREYMMRPGASSALQQALAVLTSEGQVTLLVSAEMAANAKGTSADRIVMWGSDEGAPRDLPAGFEAVAEAFGRPPPRDADRRPPGPAGRRPRPASSARRCPPARGRRWSRTAAGWATAPTCCAWAAW